MKNGNWHLASIWNEALDAKEEREYEPRDYIWASELGGSYYDRYYRMDGRKPTTPPNLRSRRKFEGGNLTEWIVQQILARAGILQSTQEYIMYEGVMKVTGKADFTAGGQINTNVKLSDLPETFQIAAKLFLKTLQEKYPDGLQEVNLEIKSCSGLMFDRYLKAPSQLHGLQAFHYAYNTDRPTLLIYVSRDDFRIVEWIIKPDSETWLELYLADIEQMKEILELDEPEKEPLLSWDDERFSKNWKVEYSNYLTDYGFKRPDLYVDKARVATRLNNVLKRIRAGKDLTKVNKEALQLGIEFYPDVENIINKEMEKYGRSTEPNPSESN